MNDGEIKKKARSYRNRLGGTVFAFPIEETNPFSKYAVVAYFGKLYHVFPTASDVHEAAVGVITILEEYKKRGIDSDYQNNVRFISMESQMNAPSVTMRRIRDTPGTHTVIKQKSPTSRQEE